MLLIAVLQLAIYPLVLSMAKKMQKKSMMLISIASCSVGFLAVLLHQPLATLFGSQPVPPGLVGLAGEKATIGNLIVLIIIGLAFVYPLAAASTIGSSMFADVAVFDRVKTGRSSAGMFMAVLNLTSIIKQTLVPAISGAIIYVGSVNEEPSALGIRLSVVISLALIIPACFCYFSINEKEIRAVIAADEKAHLAAQNA
jgi:Na+/melibiose symporter-like transporter